VKRFGISDPTSEHRNVDVLERPRCSLTEKHHKFDPPRCGTEEVSKNGDMVGWREAGEQHRDRVTAISQAVLQSHTFFYSTS